MPICTWCGENNENEGPICVKCGNPLPGSQPSVPDNQNVLACPKCGTKYEAGDQFCTRCGNTLDLPVPPESKPDPAPADPAPLACPKCGKGYEKGDKFCTKCGTSFVQPAKPVQNVFVPAPVPSPAPTREPEQKNICPECGEINPKSLRFCANCGSSLASSDSVFQKTQNPFNNLIVTPAQAPRQAQTSGQKNICPTCGEINSTNSHYCVKCGGTLNPVNKSVNATQVARRPTQAGVDPLTLLTHYDGQEKTFSLEGHEFTISKEMDAYVYYRKMFKQAAKFMVQQVMPEYNAQVHNLDDYFAKFPIMYVHYRRFLIDQAVKILISYDIYDISREEFEEELGNEFSKCNVKYQELIEAFNQTIEDNQARAAMRGSLLPTVFFSGGVLGFAKAIAYNAASTAIVEASIRNANVTRAQRNELFRRITLSELFEDVFHDYWDVHYSLTYRLHESGADVWYPSVEGNTKAQGLMRNLNSNLIPEDRIVTVLLKIFETRPMQTGCLDYVVRKFGRTPEVKAICDYYGYEAGIGN
ncbi:MAG: hypothetical protein E7386_00245 [Ruminococcaceae bacterium]|nr:hypothetical protein [Oscillospiraceae bacterium]